MDCDSLRILLVGNGGREHALAWKLGQSPRVEKIYVVPGNGGTANGMRSVINVSEVKPDDYAALVAFAKKHDVNLVLPGPEAPLVDGIEGYFRAAGIRCFGPTKAAARMEGSKAFSKDFMARHNIPTAAYKNFDDYEAAKQYLESVSHKVVLKASGLAAGKGVIIPQTNQDAQDALRQIMLVKEFGNAGDDVVIEEFLEGDELSFLTFSDGYTIRSLPPAQDHKQIHDGDQGPNTGGMGCYAPTRIASKQLIEEVHRTILQPTVDGMRKEGFPFVGILFTGLMITKSGPKTLEYNVRFGDPETQTLLPLMSSACDLAEIMVACTEHWLDAIEIKTEPKFSATVVAAAGGYPGPYVRGDEITLETPPSDTMIFHAGTSLTGGSLKTSGGRVIATTCTAATLEEAVKGAYTGISSISFSNMYYRKDIGHRAFEKPSSSKITTVSTDTETPLTYAAAGVSITAGNSLVSQIKATVLSTARPGTDAAIGGFGGLFDLSLAGYTSAPTLIGAIDGVGTKLKIAHAMNKHNTVGIDLVAMNVNDLVVQGADPLFFLDCYSCGRLDVATAQQFVSGVAEGCRRAGCALIGGETAEMPGLFAADEYDAVGAAVGAVPHGKRILPDKDAMTPGDVLLALASSGLHSNGFSLVRKILERHRLGYHDPAPWDRQSVGDSLLTPTRIYVRSLLPLVAADRIKGMAHITGGGLVENIPRMLPARLAAEVDVGTWEMPGVFRWLMEKGPLEVGEVARAFNVGVGMVVVVGRGKVERVLAGLRERGERVWEVGRLVERAPQGEGCVLRGLEAWRGR